MITFPTQVESELIELSKNTNVYLEGNILKLVSTSSEVFTEYLDTSTSKDTDNRKKRLDVTKQFQDQNKELLEKQQENDQLMQSLQDALSQAEKAKEDALNDLSIMQKKSQYELIGNIVQVALCVILGVGITVTGMYVYSMALNSAETTLIGSTWSNLFGILLTNSFSIIGTIMGVKYANNEDKKKL
tara:strand:- start:1385 stop:1945 length:561 start_codon:yes stop_codon:yes gene_type:complete